MSRRSDRTRDAVSAVAIPAGLSLGLLADRLLGDPVRWHPVAGFGSMASALEKRLYADSRTSGAWYTTVLVSGVACGGAVAGELIRRRCPPGVEVGVMAAATWAVLGGTTLLRVADRVADDLARDDIDGARAMIPSLCARDPELLDAAGICRATVESVAENTSDATVAPLVWGAIAGLPGLLGYRAVNTLDAMVGYRSPRYRQFGWASARLDDLANILPARLAATLTVALSGAPGDAWRTWRRDAGRHPSPNAGVVEAAMAGALGVRLGGPTVYGHGVEDRPVLGSGSPPSLSDLRAAVALSSRIQIGAVIVAAGARLGWEVLRRRTGTDRGQ